MYSLFILYIFFFIIKGLSQGPIILIVMGFEPETLVL